MPVSILLDDKAYFVFVQKRLNLLAKGEASNSHEVGRDGRLSVSGLSQQIERLPHSQVATAQRHDPYRGSRSRSMTRRRDVSRGGLVFQREAIHNLLVLGRCLRIGAKHVVPGPAREVCTAGVDTGERAGCNVFIAFADVPVKGSDLCQFLRR